MSRDERKTMIVREHPGLSLSRQCRLLSLSRSSIYYAAKGESAETLALMRDRPVRVLWLSERFACHAAVAAQRQGNNSSSRLIL